MTVWNSGATFAGGSGLAVPATLRLSMWPIFFGAGTFTPAMIQRFNLAQTFAAAGLVDTWQVSDFWEQAYDPRAPGSGVMQLRKPRLAQEGFFGDD